MPYDPEWIVANLDDMIELCTAIPMQESVEALKVARRVCEWDAVDQVTRHWFKYCQISWLSTGAFRLLSRD